MTFKEIKTLIDHNEWDRALQLLETLGREDQILGQIYRCRILRLQGKLKPAFALSTEILDEIPEEGYETSKLALFVERAWIFLEKRNQKESLKLLRTGEDFLETFPDEARPQSQSWVAELYFLKGVFHPEKDQSIRAMHKAIELFRAMDDPLWLAHSYRNLAQKYRVNFEFAAALAALESAFQLYQALDCKFWMVHTHMGYADAYLHHGAYDQAITHLQQGLNLAQQLEDNHTICMIYVQFCHLNLHRGNVLQARDFISKGAEHVKNAQLKQSWADVMTQNQLGRLYYETGELSQSITHFEGALQMSRERYPTNVYGPSYMLYSLVKSALAMNDLKLAETYLDELEQLLETHREFKWVLHFTTLAKALILKTKPRSKDKIAAQQLFEELLREKWEVESTVLVLVNLCDLLLDELKLYGNPEVLHEIERLLHQLKEMGDHQHSFNISVQLTQLQAKLAVLEGQLDHATELLTTAQKTVEAKGMGFLLQSICNQQTALSTQFNEWQTFLARNPALHVQIEQAELQQYITKAVQIISDPSLDKTHS